MTQRVITNQETLAIYFHQVNERHPQSVLDIGMVLKRLGTVSRQARGNEISKDLLLCGIDYFSQFHMEVYHKVYNTILNRAQFLNCLLTLPAFDMVVLLEMDEILDREEEDIIWEAYIIPNVKGVLTDVKIAKRQYEAGRIFNFDILSTVFCKYFLAKVAKYFWRMLHLQIGESCKALAGSYPTSHIAIADSV